MGGSSGQDFLDSRRKDRRVQLIIDGLKRPIRQSPKGCFGTPLLTSDGKSKSSRLSLVRQGHFGQAGKVRKPEEIMRRIKGPKLGTEDKSRQPPPKLHLQTFGPRDYQMTKITNTNMQFHPVPFNQPPPAHHANLPVRQVLRRICRYPCR